jgi:hypothetical protein
MPVRQCLGRLLLKAQLPEEAEQVYRDDLNEYLGNGWSLWGLLQSMKAQPGKFTPAAMAQVAAQLKEAWARADVSLTSSCLAIA